MNKQHISARNIKKFFASFPSWTLSVVLVIIFIWMMITPSAFMEKFSDRFLLIDNWCHLILGLLIALALCFDWQRKHRFIALTVKYLILFTVTGFIITGTLEVLQILTPEEYRRWYDPYDLLWQAIGAVLGGAIYGLFQRLWSETSLSTKEHR